MSDVKGVSLLFLVAAIGLLMGTVLKYRRVRRFSYEILGGALAVVGCLTAAPLAGTNAVDPVLRFVPAVFFLAGGILMLLGQGGTQGRDSARRS